MPAILLEPQNDSSHHPAYRYINLWAINPYTTDHYGCEIEFNIWSEATIYKLFSRKVVGQVLGASVYEFDMQAMLQNLVSYDIYGYGQSGIMLCPNSMKFIEGSVFDWYLDAEGLAVRDSDDTDFIGFFILNAALQHTQWHNNISIWHFTMNAYLYNVMGPDFKFLTNKPDGSYVCLGDSEFLPLIYDDPNINGIRVTVYNSSGVITGRGFMYNLTFISYGIWVINGRQNIGVGPLNINNTITWDYTSVATPSITASTYRYTVEIGTLNEVGGSPVFVSVKTRTYYMDCPCCTERQRIKFLNCLGGIDTIYFNQILEKSQTVKSTEYQKNLDRPHTVIDSGNLRLSTDGAASMRMGKSFRKEEMEFVNDFLRSVRAWWYNGSQLEPVKLKDDSVKMDYLEDEIYVEFELELSNDYIGLRN